MHLHYVAGRGRSDESRYSGKDDCLVNCLVVESQAQKIDVCSSYSHCCATDHLAVMDVFYILFAGKWQVLDVKKQKYSHM